MIYSVENPGRHPSPLKETVEDAYLNNPLSMADIPSQQTCSAIFARVQEQPCSTVCNCSFSYLYIAKQRNIERVDLETMNAEDILSNNDNAPQVLSADTVTKDLFWVNFNDTHYVLMLTSHNKETSTLWDIAFSSEVSIGQDLLYFYVLVVDMDTVYKYKKSTWEIVDRIEVGSDIEQIIIVQGKICCAIHQASGVIRKIMYCMLLYKHWL